MIDHIGFPVSGYERAKAFYLRALAPLAPLALWPRVPRAAVTGSGIGKRFRVGARASSAVFCVIAANASPASASLSETRAGRGVGIGSGFGTTIATSGLDVATGGFVPR